VELPDRRRLGRHAAQTSRTGPGLELRVATCHGRDIRDWSSGP
jgi:hypothetical protein